MNNPGIAAAVGEIERTDAVRKGAYSTLLPQVSLTGGFARAKSETAVSTTTGTAEVVTSTFGDQEFWSNYADTYTAQLEVQQTLFDGFATRGNVDKARAETSVAVAKLLTQKAGASYELKTAFAQLLYAQELITILGEIIDQRERNLRMVELKYENGRENKGALLLSEAQLSQARLDLTQAGRLVRVSRIQLATVMGRPAYSDFEAKGKLAPATPDKDPDYRKLALKTPATFQQAAATEAAKAGITIAQSTFYPQISAFANVSSQGTSGFDAPESWAVGLNGTWDVFDGTKTYFNVRAARIAHETSLSTLRQTMDDTARTLAENYRSYADAVDQIGVGAELYAASSLRAQIAEAQYRNGLVSFQDFDTITNDKINRQKQDLLNRRDAVLAEAAWEQSLGVGAIP
ncbi:MAG: hypothetical protein RIQ71_902 [Verrucomicrobiota bacterium]